MKQNGMTNEMILDAVYDIADEKGLKIDDFVRQLQNEAEQAAFEGFDDLPEEVKAELESAKALRRESREVKKKTEKSGAIKSEVERFRELFPDTKPEDIPAEIWDEVADGVPLSHAYALHLIRGESERKYAEQVNGGNSSRAASASGQGESEAAFTKEQVEGMSPKEVARNFKSILKSVAGWKL